MNQVDERELVRDEQINREILIKEIDLIQSCINRMAQNSFVIKGWLISLLSVTLVLLPETFNIKIFCIIALTISVCFWYLDGFFLKTERQYRRKYNWVIKNRLSTIEHCYDLNPNNPTMWLETEQNPINILSVMWSKTLLPIYLLPIIASIYTLFA